MPATEQHKTSPPLSQHLPKEARGSVADYNSNVESGLYNENDYYWEKKVYAMKAVTFHHKK
ncbi:hypothetical protein NC651_019317 [Populus alba x Populus x berolinensis]|nr:hypothetical protein NC651_019317 [Populus alba x Populus x berolinensis]